MAASDIKPGPLSRADLLALWTGAVDKSYSTPLIAAGEGNGLEAYTQVHEQLARVSRAIDTSTQAMYMLSWSGQTAEPSAGEGKATVTLSFSRTLHIEQTIIITAGQVFIEEETKDWGTPEGVLVTTGRRYTLQADLVFMPGEAGPKTAVAVAERPGWGYNNPYPGTIKAIEQVGVGFNNISASVERSLAASSFPGFFADDTRLVVQNVPDVVIPQHVGQYVLFNTGVNLGRIFRMTSYTKPDPDAGIGGEVQLENVLAVSGSVFVGTFVVGETVKIFDGVVVKGHGRVLATSAGKVAIAFTDFVSDSWFGVVITSIEGLKSLATLTVTQNMQFNFATTEVGTAEWGVLDWEGGLGITCTNAASPTGGKLAMLDALGRERKVERASSETDASYRERVTTPSDVVSPNALRRAANRVFVPLGYAPELREVGSDLFPGFYYDAGGTTDVTPLAARNSAWDMEEIIFTGGADTGTFFEGEMVFQAATGAYGYAVLTRTPGPFPCDVPTDVNASSLDGVVHSCGMHAFDASEVVGMRSGAKRTPAVVTPPPAPDAARFKVWLDFTEMRAFFLMVVPKLGFGEFGLNYDHDALDPVVRFNGYDFDAADGTSGLFASAYDGYPYRNAGYYLAVWQALINAHAGGVGFDLVVDPKDQVPTVGLIGS